MHNADDEMLGKAYKKALLLGWALVAAGGIRTFTLCLLGLPGLPRVVGCEVRRSCCQHSY